MKKIFLLELKWFPYQKIGDNSARKISAGFFV